MSLVLGLRRAATIWLSVGALLGCSSLHEYFPSNSSSLPNADAVDRALTLCSLTHGDEPFHLKMLITPPQHSGRDNAFAPEVGAMQAEIELWWLNPITYRTEIRSAAFRQTRIVNGRVIEEQNIGAFYPRWIQNFVDALFEPAPHADKLRKEPGSIPISQESHACISRTADSPDETSIAQVCFQGEQPLLASGVTFSRYVAFDNFTAFGHQLVPRTLINDLPANVLVRGHILLLEPLPQSAYSRLKATHFTPPSQQISTQLVARSEAEAMLLTPLLEWSDINPASNGMASDTPSSNGLKTLASYPTRNGKPSRPGKTTRNDLNSPSSKDPVTVYVRTDRTGRVREAYTDRNDVYNQHQGAVARAMQLRFRPLIVNGAPQQMEAPIQIR